MPRSTKRVAVFSSRPGTSKMCFAWMWVKYAGRALESFSGEFDAVGVDGEATFLEHPHDVDGGAGPDRVQDQVHRVHACFGRLFGVYHHALGVRGDADEACADKVMDSGLFGRHNPKYAVIGTGCLLEGVHALNFAT